jgi:hypothetical protein
MEDTRIRKALTPGHQGLTGGEGRHWLYPKSRHHQFSFSMTEGRFACLAVVNGINQLQESLIEPVNASMFGRRLYRPMA